MKNKKGSSGVGYKRGNVEISIDATPDIINLARRDQILSWAFKFSRLIFGYLVVKNYFMDAANYAIKLVSWLF